MSELGFILPVRPAAIVAAAIMFTVTLAQPAARAEKFFALTAEQRLIQFDGLDPSVVTAGMSVGGIPPILAIARRPTDQNIYALIGNGALQVYSGTNGSFSNYHNVANDDTNGSRFALAFDPTADRLRMISDAGQNVLINPDTAAIVATGTAPSYAAGDPNFGRRPNIADIAYTTGTGRTTLYGIDSALDLLVRIGSPGGSPLNASTGQLFTVGALGVNASDHVGFDISPSTGIAYAVMDTPGASGLDTSKLYTIDLTTGHASLVGEVGGGMDILSAAVVPGTVPEPASLSLWFGTAAVCIRRRGRP